MGMHTSNHYLDNDGKTWKPSNGQIRVPDGAGGYTDWDGTLGGAPGTTDTRNITFNAAADLPANEAAITTGELITLNNYAAGKKRAIISYHASGGQIPHAGSVGVFVNGTPADAATGLSITDVSEGGTLTTSNGPPMVSESSPRMEISLIGTDFDIDTIYLVGYAPGGTGAGTVRVTVVVK